MLVKCPRCGVEGKLYYSRRIGFYIKHGNSTHYVNKNTPLEVCLSDHRLNLIKYMGGDTFLLPYLASMIPPHTCYVEVFGGGAPLLLNKPPSKVEVYNDVDGDLVNLFRVVKECFNDFMKELEFVLHSRKLYYEALEGLKKERDPVRRASLYYYVVRVSYGGIFGSGFSVSKVRNNALSFHNAVRDLRKIHRRLRYVTIEQLDFRECIKRYDSTTTFFYLDPPHLYTGTEKGTDYYVHGFTDSDFFDLLNILEGVEGRFLLKQVVSTTYLEEWSRRNKFSTRVVEISNYAKLTSGNRRERVKYYFIANYRI